MKAAYYAFADIDWGVNGDLVFDGQDIRILTEMEKVLYQYTVDFLRSNKGDYALSPSYGANLSEHLGQGLDINLGKSIANKVKTDIIDAGIVDRTSIEVYPILSNNTLYVRVILFSSEELVVNLTINNLTGVTVSA